MAIKAKNISKILIASILFSNLNINSNAGTLSEDKRYEYFEDSSIVVNNILEEDSVDVNISGNTLLNLIGDATLINNTNTTAINNDGSITFTHEQTPIKQTKVHFSDSLVETNKTYTLFFNIIENTLTRNDSGTTVAKFNLVNWNTGTYLIKTGTTGYQKVVLTQADTTTHNGKPYFEVNDNALGKIIIDDIMILEGDWSNKETPRCFKGIKSVGELERDELKVISLPNENLLPKSDLKFTTTKDKEHSGYFLTIDNEVAKKFINKELTLSFDVHSKGEGKNSLNNPNFTGDNNINRFGAHGQIYWKSSKNPDISTYTYPLTIIHNYNIDKERVSVTSEIIAPEGYDIMQNFGISIQPFRMPSDDNNEEWYMSNFKLEYGSKATPWIPNVDETIYSSYIEKYATKISIKEPLRGLPDGTRDRIIKKNGQWVVERNCGEIKLDGSSDEPWIKSPVQSDDISSLFYINIVDRKSYSNIINNIFSNIDGYKLEDNTGDGIYLGLDVNVRITNSKLSEATETGFRDWLSVNPLRVIYELETPIYEPLNIDLNLPLYLDTTYITTNSAIPPVLKTTVDRAINRATEAIELARINPTTENITQARYWSNLLKETTKKDELQGQIDNITATDIKIEKKKVSANVDLYVKSQNTLTISLNTNSILFDGYNGVDALEKNQALDITINSSLPYNLNAYIPEGIVNKDSSQSIPVASLSLKDSTDTNYKPFINTSDKIVLKSNCDAGADNIHKIDFRLASSQTHKADVYKTVLKFEAEQR